MGKLTKRSIRAMQRRWEHDLERLEEAFPALDLTQNFDPIAETVRNLSTAVAEANGVLANTAPLASRYQRAKKEA